METTFHHLTQVNHFFNISQIIEFVINAVASLSSPAPTTLVILSQKESPPLPQTGSGTGFGFNQH